MDQRSMLVVRVLRKTSRAGQMRRWTAMVLTPILVASSLVVLTEPAVARTDPAGASRTKPVQQSGSAAGRSHTASAQQTDSDPGPTAPPALPPGATGVMGDDVRHPDPARMDGPQCYNCPPGFTPQVQPADGRSGARPIQAISPLRQEKPADAGWLAGTSQELTDRRTSNSTTFANADGSKTLRVYLDPMYAKGDNGRMEPIDNRLRADGQGRLRPTVGEKVSLAESSDAETLATVDLGDVQAGFGATGTRAARALVNGAEARYSEVRPGADLALEATATGWKESIILKSADAPTTWVFPLRLRGLTPELVPDAGRVDLKDAQGRVRATIPAGYMTDAAFDPKTMQGPHSTDVAYRLLNEGGSWSLEVSVDPAWVKDPARKFPIVVDPTMRTANSQVHDTFVSTRTWPNRDNSAMGTLNVGHWADGENAAAYLRFLDAEGLVNQYITGASLNLYDIWAASCTPSALDVYAVAQSWTEGSPSTYNWPGPDYNASQKVATRSFSRGGYCSSVPAGLESIPIDYERFTDWTHGRERWYGFSLRASTTDSNSQKIFNSSENTLNLSQPFMDISYAPEGHRITDLQPIYPPVTPTTTGTLNFQVENRGSTTWNANYALVATIINASTGATVQTITSTVGSWGYTSLVPNGHTGVSLQIAPLPVGTYNLRMTMRTSGGVDFASMGVPPLLETFQVYPIVPPQLLSVYPPNNAQIPTLTPTLWGQYYDPDNYPGGTPYYWFRICNGTPDAPVGCVDSNWITSPTYQVAPGMLSWAKTSFWYVALYDGANATPLLGPFYATPTVAQPEITHSLADSDDGSDVPGINPQAGNYSTTAVDANVVAAGPPLQILRTYNSQDPRGAGPDMNLALGRTATGTAPCTAAEGPSKAFNGTVAGGTTDKFCSRDAAAYLQVDLGSTKTVRSVTVRHAGAGGELVGFNTKDFDILTSVDGTVWTTSAAVVNNTLSVTTHSLPATAARFVRLKIRTPSSNGDVATRIYELEVNGNGGAFGAGWATPLDQNIALDSDGSGNVVVTLATGRQVRFGKNADGTFAPPPGLTMSLVRGASTWTLREANGYMRVFDNLGNLTSIADAYGRKQSYVYTDGRVTEVRDLASGRKLSLTWTDGHVTSVAADAPVAGGARPTWTYTYTGNQLKKMCPPVNGCVEYAYTASGSHYRSVVLDDNPIAYWPLSDVNSGTAANIAAHTPGEREATYTNVTLGQTGALTGTPDTAAAFDAARPSSLVAPDNLTNPSMAFAVELWFKAASGKNGVLFEQQNTALGTAPARFAPSLYIGTDFLLRGMFYSPTGGTQIVSPVRVDDNSWHHVVLSVNLDRQDLFLDGVAIGSTSGNTINQLDMVKSQFGNGYTVGWTAAANGYFPFTGLMDDIAVYRHTLGATQVSAHFAARKATTRMTTVTEPGGFVAAQATYDAAAGRVTAYTDRNGAAWTLGMPAVAAPVDGQSSWSVTLSAQNRDPVTYRFDPDRGNRLIARQDGSGTAKWEYDSGGFLRYYTDANNRTTAHFHDARGNTTWIAQWRSGNWHWSQFGYYLNAADPLDPRNDQLVFRSGVRNAYDADPLNRIVYDLDAVGRRVKTTWPRPYGAAAKPFESTTYSAGTEAAVGGGLVPAGLPLTNTAKAGGTTTYAYNSRGDLVSSVDARALTTVYAYDLLGRPISRTTSSAAGTYGTWTMTYSPESQLQTETAPAVTNPLTGVIHTKVTEFTYDTGGRVIQRRERDSTGGDLPRTWTYTFDTAGRPASITAPDASITRSTWNTAGDVATETQVNGLMLERFYDGARRLIQTDAVGAGVDPDNATATRLSLESRAYDPSGQLASVTDAMGRETVYTYYDDGLVDSVKRVRRNPQGTITSSVVLRKNEYDHGGLLIRVTEAGGIVRDIDYDDAANTVRETLDGGGLSRTTTNTFSATGLTATRTHGSGLTFVTATGPEAQYLFANNGSQISLHGTRFADGNSTYTYKISFPADAVSGTIRLELSNQYLVHTSPDNATWTERMRETADIRSGSNRTHGVIDVTSLLATSKTVYVRIGDSQPATAWGGQLYRAAIDFTRSGQQPAKTTFSYTPAGDTQSVRVENTGGTPSFLLDQTFYDPRGMVSRTIAPGNVTNDYAYDTAGDIRTVVGGARTVWRDGVETTNAVPTTTYGHNTFGDMTEVRDPHGAITTTAVDQLGRPTRTTLPTYTSPDGPVTSSTQYTYAAVGKPDTVTDPLGRQTTFTYDKYGRLIRKTLPGPAPRPFWTYKYDRGGEPVETVDPIGAVTSATYNDLGAQITETAAERTPSGTLYYTTTFERDDAGFPTRVTTPITGHTTTVSTNRAGEPVLVTDPAGVTAERRYDALGRVTAEILAGKQATTYMYDQAGREISVSDHTVSGGVLSAPLRTGSTAYGAFGKRSSTTTPEGRVTDYGYDSAANPTSITQRDPGGDVTVNLGYDLMGHRTRMVDGKGRANNYGYNDWGLPTWTQDPVPGPDGRYTTVYDAAGQPVSERLPGGVRIDRVFGDLGQVIRESGSGAVLPTADRVYVYDNAGRMTQAGEYTYAYNDRGLLASTTSIKGNASFGYDGEGNMTSRTDLAGTATFTYDAAGRLATALDPLTANTATYTYDTTGAIDTIGYGSGRPSRKYTYDNYGRVATDTVKNAAGAAVLSVGYGYDKDDLLTSRTTGGFSSAGAHTFGYDGLGRLTRWTKPDTTQTTYGYDGASNRTRVTDAAGTRTFVFDDRDRLMTASGGGQPSLTNSWSPRGTLESTTVNTATTRYEYDAFDQPGRVVTQTEVITYTYDGLGLLSSRNSSSLAFADLSNNAVALPTASGNAVVARGPDGSATADRTGTNPGRLLVGDPVHGDLLGAVDAQSGAVSAERTYAPFGGAASGMGSFTLGFQGGYADPVTGQVNAHARWYDPGQAIWTGRDSLTLAPDPVIQANRYGYANASPLSHADTNGHCPVDGCVFEVGVALFLLLGLAIGAYAVSHTCQLTGCSIPQINIDELDIWPEGKAGLPSEYDTVEMRTLLAISRAHPELQSLINSGLLHGLTAAALLDMLMPKVQTTTTSTTGSTPFGGVTSGTFGAFATAAAITAITRPAIGATITNLRPATVSLLPSGQLLQNGIAPSTALSGAVATIPAIVMAEAGTTESQNAANAAVGAAISAAATGVEAASADDTKCSPEDEIVALIEELAEEVMLQGYDALEKSLSSSHRERLKAEPWKKGWAYGHVVHQKVADLLNKLYPKGKNPDGTPREGRFIYSRSDGPDYFDTLLEFLTELTTPGEVAKHKRKAKDDPRYGTCRYATYKLFGRDED